MGVNICQNDKKPSSKMSVDPDMDMAVKLLHYINESNIAKFDDTDALERLEQAESESKSRNESKSKSKGAAK